MISSGDPWLNLICKILFLNKVTFTGSGGLGHGHCHLGVTLPSITTTLKNDLSVSCKVNTNLPCNSEIPLLSIYPWEIKAYVSANIRSNLIHNSPNSENWKQLKCPSTGMDKRIVCPQDGRLLSNRKNYVLICVADKSQKQYVLWKKPDTKEYKRYDSISVKL